MRFSREDIQRFADWSGDHNPLHVDAEAARRTVFGQTVVHGMLSAVRALSSDALTIAQPIERIDIEFRSALFPESEYELVPAAVEQGAGAIIKSGDATLMTIQVNQPGAPQPAPDLSWVAATRAHGTPQPGRRAAPAVLDAEDLAPGYEITGRYELGLGAERQAGGLSPVHARVLGLSSYLVGMELPGLRSLFTRLSLTFARDLHDPADLLYRARITRFDRHFRILDVHLEIATPDGDFVAAGEVRSYVRFSPIVTSPERLASHLSPQSHRLAGRVVLVCGGSRGLGAELTTALAMAGCHVYASFHRDRAAAQELAKIVEQAGARIELLEGDAGDPAWCAASLETIRARHGRVDALVLNACAPPTPMRLGAGSARAFSDYIEQNLRLAQVPA